ncbi:MAG: metal ABC transporter solute-binding protein, Zn/Mn family [Rhodospirillales bacterium]
MRTGAGLAAVALAPWPVRAQQGRPPLGVLVTIAMIGDLAQRVGGDRVAVTALMGEGVDPHLYKPTREDIRKMLAADVVFYNGLLLEGKMSDAFVRVARAGKPVYAVTELLPEEELLEPPDAPGHVDPHVWMDPRAWSQAAALIADKLAGQDRGGADRYRANLAAVQAEIARLDAYAEQAIGTIPAGQRVLVTAHDAFNYFARRYGVQVEGIQGLSTESEAGVRRVGELVELLASRRIPAVFAETSVSDRNIRAVVEGARARGHQVALGPPLFSDAMGAPGTYEGTYVGMIDHNVTSVVRALGGTAPERGMNGRLRPAASPP